MYIEDSKKVFTYDTDCNYNGWARFETCYDLSCGIDVYVKDDFSDEDIIRSISGFMFYWSREIWDNLNGFSGLDNKKWRIHKIHCNVITDEVIDKYKSEHKNV